MPLRAKKATAGGERVRIQWELEGILAAANACGLRRAVRRVGFAPPPYERCHHPDSASRPGFARRVCGGEPTRTRAFWQRQTRTCCGELSVGWGLPHRRTNVAITRTVRRGQASRVGSVAASRHTRAFWQQHTPCKPVVQFGHRGSPACRRVFFYWRQSLPSHAHCSMLPRASMMKRVLHWRRLYSSSISSSR